MNKTTRREWTFASVSAAEAGDFLQVTFSDDPESADRYVLLSAQFEFPQEHDIQIETNGGEWFAQLKVAAASLSRSNLTLDGDADGERVAASITFAATDSEFDELLRVVKIMLPMTETLR